MPYRSVTPAKYSQQLNDHEPEPSPTHEDVATRTIPLDGGTAVVEHVDGRAEVTIRLGGRIVCGLALSEREADEIGMALARPGGFTVGDYWDMRDVLYPADRTAGAR